MQDYHQQSGSISAFELDYESLFYQIPLPICFLKGRECIFTYVNPEYTKLFNYKELLGRSLFEAFPEAEGQPFYDLMQEVMQTGIPFEGKEFPIYADFNNGEKPTLRYVDFSYTPYRNSLGVIEGIVCCSYDVTEQVLARKKVEEVRDTLNAILEALPQMAWTADAQGHVNYYNHGWYNYTGQTYEQALGKGWLSIIHEDDVHYMKRHWQESVALGIPCHKEARYRKYTGEYRWHLTKAVPIYNSSGDIMLWSGTCTDIHDQKMQTEELEKRVQERTQELQQSNYELEQFAHVASHDLQEPLRKIKIYAEMIRASSFEKLDGASQRQIEKIHDAAQRMSGSLKALLEFTHLKKEEQFVLVDLNVTLAHVLNDLELAISQKGALIELEELPTLQAVPHQMHQLFYNLINNALKFTKADTTPHIRVQVRTLEAALKGDGLYYEIAVSDNGIGFEQKYADQIFTIFQRLHDRSAYSGTGIGLSLCKRVVQNHGGSIHALSQPNQGATFIILLPY